MTVEFSLGGQDFVALNGGPKFKFGTEDFGHGVVLLRYQTNPIQ